MAALARRAVLFQKQLQRGWKLYSFHAPEDKNQTSVRQKFGDECQSICSSLALGVGQIVIPCMWEPLVDQRRYGIRCVRFAASRPLSGCSSVRGIGTKADRGQHIDVDLLGTLIASLSHYVQIVLVSGRAPLRPARNCCAA